MSQVETPKTTRIRRLWVAMEKFVKEWEWTWTTAVVFSLGIVFTLLIGAAVIPSFWLYTADQKLKWNGSGPSGFWLLEARDAVAMGFSTGPIITVLVLSAIMQNWRRKLRGKSDSRPTGGYR
jgi:hypothetical protein